MIQHHVLTDVKNSGGLAVDSLWVYTTVSLPWNKYRVYTPMVGSSTINIMVYANFGDSPKFKV